MKVCMLATSFPRWRGDHASHFVFELARHLVAQGVAVRLVGPRGDRPDGSAAPREETWDGVEIRRFAYFVRRWERLAYGGGIPANLGAHPLRTITLLPFFCGAFAHAARRAAGGCDLVHAHWTLTAAVASVALPRLPCVVTVHGSDVNRAPRSGLIARCINRGLRRAARVVAVSRPLAEQVVARGVPSERVEVIINGMAMPRELARHNGGAWRMLWAGRMSPVKNVPLLIDAFARVREREPRARLILVGDGPDRPKVEQAVAERGLDAWVSFEGMQPPGNVGSYYARADLLVLSSASEGLPLVLLEAMAHGLPVVSTAVGGIPDVIEDGVNGRLVPPGDAVALADGMAAVIGSAALRDRMGSAARRTAEPFTWERTAQEYKRVFGQVLGAESSARAPLAGIGGGDSRPMPRPDARPTEGTA